MHLNITNPGFSDEPTGFLLKRSIINFIMRVGLFYTFFVLLSIQLLVAHPGRSQALDSIQVTVKLSNESLKDLFKKIEQQSGLMFAYQPREVVDYKRITLPMETRSVRATLDIALENTPLKYRQVNNNVIVFSKGKRSQKFWTENEALALTVSGSVMDASGNPIPGVNIVVKGTTKGTTTDSNGKYSINANENDVLVFSFIGYSSQEVAVNARSVIDVALLEDVHNLEEVVVVGYGEQRK